MRVDIIEAIDWYENRQAGLGLEFAAELLSRYRHLVRDARHYAVRFADVRRLNPDRFPYGRFYVIRAQEIWLLAVLHARRQDVKDDRSHTRLYSHNMDVDRVNDQKLSALPGAQKIFHM